MAITVGGKINIGQAIIIYITNCYTAAIIIIQVIKNTKPISFFLIIFKMYMGI